jgi:hypothetical protein
MGASWRAASDAADRGILLAEQGFDRAAAGRRHADYMDLPRRALFRHGDLSQVLVPQLCILSLRRRAGVTEERSRPPDR